MILHKPADNVRSIGIQAFCDTVEVSSTEQFVELPKSTRQWRTLDATSPLMVIQTWTKYPFVTTFLEVKIELESQRYPLRQATLSCLGASPCAAPELVKPQEDAATPALLEETALGDPPPLLSSGTPPPCRIAAPTWGRTGRPISRSVDPSTDQSTAPLAQTHQDEGVKGRGSEPSQARLVPAEADEENQKGQQLG
uniref:Uncharacterized protein n=1 Tax=Sphaerodactylus townsendi TaxID=933632 RepID=A0ACB8ETU0_9SAUR